MKYNTQREHLQIREYGRHIQTMINSLLTTEDEELKAKNIKAIIEVMAFFNKDIKNVDNYKQTLWDHLHIISDFKLDAEGDFPKPNREQLFEKPNRLPYPDRHPKYSHLGKNIELVINKALEEQDEDKKEAFANTVAYFMKLAYSNWHKELVQDDAIQQELSQITKGELEFTNKLYVKHRNDSHTERDDYTGTKPKKKFFKQGSNNNSNNKGGFQNNRNNKFNKNFKKRF